MTYKSSVRFHKVDDLEQLAQFIIELHYHIGGAFSVTDDDSYYYVTLV